MLSVKNKENAIPHFIWLIHMSNFIRKNDSINSKS